MAAVIWAMENPQRGICDPDDLDFQRVLELAGPYLGNVLGVYSDWTPLKDRGRLFRRRYRYFGSWQFKNFRVAFETVQAMVTALRIFSHSGSWLLDFPSLGRAVSLR